MYLPSIASKVLYKALGRLAGVSTRKDSVVQPRVVGSKNNKTGKKGSTILINAIRRTEYFIKELSVMGPEV